MSEKYEMHPTSYTIIASKDNVVYGASAIIVSIDDEGGGPFISIKANHEAPPECSTVWIDFGMWSMVDRAVKALQRVAEAAYPTEEADSSGESAG